MTPSRSPARPVLIAMLCAGAVTAQFVGGKATRDALFFQALDFTALPSMIIATSISSIVLVVVNTSLFRRFAPASLVPAYFAGSGVLFLAEWALTARLPAVAAVIVYLHMSGAGPLLGSGFWLIVSDRFDPRTAKKRFGQIAGVGTLGGLCSALVAERVGALIGAEAMLPFMAALHLLSAWLVWQLAVPASRNRARGSVPAASDSSAAPPARSPLRVVTGAPYLRRLALLVLLGTASAALLDYLFKAEAVKTFGRGDNLLRFFAMYYAATSVLTFVVQTSWSRFVLERFGLALTTSTPSFALLAGGLGGLISPGFESMLAVRAGESVFRGSLFRAGYELFYTPISAADKRAAKSIIDVGCDRLGDAVGGGLIRVVMALVPLAEQRPAMLIVAMASSTAAIVAASRLNRGYILTLESSLRNRAIEIELADIQDGTTRTLVMRTLHRQKVDLGSSRAEPSDRYAAAAPAAALSPELQDIAWLQSHDVRRVTDILRREEGVTASLVPHVIPLLAWDPVAQDAIFALRKVAEEHVGQLIDALVDPNQDFAVRRRLARVFSICVSQRAADGLLLGLDDLRFEVRFQCGLSLAAILEKNPLLRIDRDHIFAVVLRETAVGRPVWESRRLLDEISVWEGVPFVDTFVRDRAGQSLSHVFTLLSLVLPSEPLQIAFRSLHTEDQYLQGTALEYLESILPPPIRQPLWPYLEDRRPRGSPKRPADEVLAELLRSNKSIQFNLEELKRRAEAAPSITTGE
jgi:ATP:ADP antiporter, AAA family